MKLSEVVLWTLVGLTIGALIDYAVIPGGTLDNPYLHCKSQGVSLDDIGECLWLLENQPAL